MASDVLRHVPDLIDFEATYQLICDDMNPLNVVLLQEVGINEYTVWNSFIIEFNKGMTYLRGDCIRYYVNTLQKGSEKFTLFLSLF